MSDCAQLDFFCTHAHLAQFSSSSCRPVDATDVQGPQSARRSRRFSRAGTRGDNPRSHPRRVPPPLLGLSIGCLCAASRPHPLHRRLRTPEGVELESRCGDPSARRTKKEVPRCSLSCPLSPHVPRALSAFWGTVAPQAGALKLALFRPARTRVDPGSSIAPDPPCAQQTAAAWLTASGQTCVHVSACMLVRYVINQSVLFMHVYIVRIMYMRVYVYEHAVHTWRMQMRMRLWMRMLLRICECMHARGHACMCVSAYARLCVCVYVLTWVCVHVRSKIDQVLQPLHRCRSPAR